MQFQRPLEKVKLIKRYKRFLADVVHPTLGEITIHCPNTGSMKNCWEPDWFVWILDSKNPNRKYQYTWVLSENEKGELIGINTHFANDIVFEGILAGSVIEVNDVAKSQREVKYGTENSRIDILITDSNNDKIFIEVKNVTLLENSEKGFFPDAVTVRGQKHLRELIEMVKLGHRAILFFLVQHTGIKTVSVARHIDPEYANLLDQAIDAGVEVIAYNTRANDIEIVLDEEISLI